MEKMLYEETEAMIKAYGNHPSFLLFLRATNLKAVEGGARQVDRLLPHRRPAPLYTNAPPHRTRVPGLAQGTAISQCSASSQNAPRQLGMVGQDYGKSWMT